MLTPIRRQFAPAALLAALFATALGCAQSHHHEHADDDVTVSLADTPASVQRTIEQHRAGGKVNEVERTTLDGRTVYEAEILTDTGEFDLVIAEDGTLLRTEHEDEADEGDENDRQPATPAASSAAIAPSLTPLRDKVAFSAVITHPYFPLSTVRYAELREEGEHVIREVQDQTRTVAGVECLVLAEKEYARGQLTEISYNCFAQDAAGNVYYFGEDVDDYKDGKVVGHGGAWMVGRNATEPCLIMPANPVVGFEFKPENSPPAAEEFDRIEKLDATLKVPAGAYADVLVIQEADKPGQWKERKYYARGVGLISENRELNLVSARPAPASK